VHPRVSRWLVVAFFLLAYNIEFRGLPGSTAFAAIALLSVLAWRQPLPLRDHALLVLLMGGVLFTSISLLRWLDGGTLDVMFRAEYLLLFGARAGGAVGGA